jgi:hypothetical protein
LTETAGRNGAAARTGGAARARSARWLIAGAAGLAAALLLYHAVTASDVIALLVGATLGAFAIVPIVARLRIAALVLATGMASLTAAEYALRVNDSRSHLPLFDPDSTYTQGYFDGRFNRERAKPGASTARRITRDGEEIYRVTYTIGADGFRLTPGNPDDGPTDVNFFGGSFTFGEGLQDDETLPYYFQRFSGTRRVKNYGFHGHGPHHVLALLEGNSTGAAKLNFLLTGPYHADRTSCAAIWTAGHPRYVLDADGQPVRAGRCVIGVRNAAALALLRDSSIFHRLWPWLAPSQDAQFRLYLATVKQVHAMFRQRGEPFLVGYIDAWRGFFRDPAWTDERILGALREDGIEIVNLTLGKGARPYPRKYYIHPFDQHPSAEANRDRAQLLADYLSASSAPDRAQVRVGN